MSRTADISIALPAYEPWRPVQGEHIAVFGLEANPNDPSTPTDSAWGICEQPMVGPLFLSDFLTISPLTLGEREALQRALGVEITDTAKEEIKTAIQQLATSVALNSRLPSWDQFESHLNKLIVTTKFVIDFLKCATERVVNGAPTVDQTLAAHIALLLSESAKQQNIPEMIKRIRIMLDACDHVQNDIKNRKSTRGPKEDIAFNIFCRAMINFGHIANADLTFLSPKTIKTKTSQTRLRAKESKDSFIQFIKQVVTLASQKGGAAIDDADLSDNEKRTAKNYLNDYKNKTRRTITDNLRSAMSQLGPKHYG